MRHSDRYVLAALLAAVCFVATPAAAQQEFRPVLKARTPAQAVQSPLTPPRPPAPPVSGSTQSANETFNDLQQILNGLPPNVRQVLALDPSLIDRPDYLAPYPRLAEFIQQHPEVQRNPSFFFGSDRFAVRERNPKTAAMEVLENVLGGAALFTGIMLAMWMVTSLLRQLIDYRRWLRQSRVQADAAAKVLDRLSGNEELLAYLQTPAGMNMLQAAPVIEAPRVNGLPIGRILWSVQAGVVLAAFGVGLWLVKGTVVEDIAPAFAVAGTVAVCVGIGFVVSAVIAWFLTQRAELFAPKA